MKKDLNRQASDKPDFSLPRSKILRGRRNFQRLFEQSAVLSSGPLQFRYRIYKNPSEGFYIGFIAPKKNYRSAVKRNRTKRLLREAYRTNQSMLQDLFLQNNFGLHGVFIAGSAGITYADIQTNMIQLLEKARTKLIKMPPLTPPLNTDT